MTDGNIRVNIRWLSEDGDSRECPMCGGSSIMISRDRSGFVPALIGLKCNDCEYEELM